MKKIKTALISVHDKVNLKFLLKNLSKHKIKIINNDSTIIQQYHIIITKHKITY